MSYAEDLVRLRQRMTDALRIGLVDEKHHGILQGTLIQLMNESESRRQACLKQVETYQRQIAIAEGQANGFAAIGSLIYQVVNGYIVAGERAAAEEQERAKERAEHGSVPAPVDPEAGKADSETSQDEDESEVEEAEGEASAVKPRRGRKPKA